MHPYLSQQVIILLSFAIMGFSGIYRLIFMLLLLLFRSTFWIPLFFLFCWKGTVVPSMFTDNVDWYVAVRATGAGTLTSLTVTAIGKFPPNWSIYIYIQSVLLQFNFPTDSLTLLSSLSIYLSIYLSIITIILATQTIQDGVETTITLPAKGYALYKLNGDSVIQ